MNFEDFINSIRVLYPSCSAFINIMMYCVFIVFLVLATIIADELIGTYKILKRLIRYCFRLFIKIAKKGVKIIWKN